MAFVRILAQLVKDKEIGQRIVRSSRTKPVPSVWKACSASWASTPVGQLYEPVDKDQVMFYREDKKGQILEEGINEAGAMSSFIAAGTRTAATTSRCCRSTSSTRCSASSVSATWPGPLATAAPVAS
jgi:pyruvate dehydrogenase complex dehydrogenase (E1) component